MEPGGRWGLCSPCKSHGPSSILRPHSEAEGENRRQSCPLASTFAYNMSASTHTSCTSTHGKVKNTIIVEDPFLEVPPPPPTLEFFLTFA